MAGMTIDFNNVRRQAIRTYNKLCRTLNENIKNDSRGNGYIHDMPTEEIHEYMDDLRSLIGAIGMSYEEGNEDCKDVYSELFPIDKPELKMEEFNP